MNHLTQSPSPSCALLSPTIMNATASLSANFELFQGLPFEDLQALDRLITISEAPKGKIFYRPEDPTDILFLLKKGTVQLYRISPEGKKLVIFTLNDGAMFGEMGLLGLQQHNAFAEALMDSVICTMNREDMEYLLAERPRLAMRFLEIIGDRLRETENQLESLTFKSIPARLAALLLRIAGERNTVEGLTHQDLAEMIGTYRETTTQTLNEMKAQGILTIGRRRIVILNKTRLAEIAAR